MDVHISVIADFKAACPFVDVTDWCLSGHAWVMKRPQDTPLHINAGTWQGIHDDMIKKFQDQYDAFFRTFDMFIVAHASVFALVFEKYKKPILMINSCRFDLPFCWTGDRAMRQKYIECLRSLSDQKLLTVVANNRADQLYFKKGTGIDAGLIPSLCLYTNAIYTPTKQTFLMYHGPAIDHPLISRKPPPGYGWNEITQYKGLISFPYEVSLMSLFEYFTAGMPMFFPTKAYWKANPGIQSISAYWKGEMPDEYAELKSTDTWIELSDIYTTFQSPNTHYFDSIPHLLTLLETFTYVDDRAFRESYKQQILHAWREKLRQ